MDDEQMVQQLKNAGACSDLPPLALAEVVHLVGDDFQVRRLHLIMVDLWRQKWLPAQTIGLLRKSMREVPAGPRTLNTTSIRLSASTGRRQHQIRLDGSTYPCYCVYPERGEDHSFQLVDSATGYIMAISRAESMKPLGVAHFYHAFSVNPDCEDGPNFRAAALEAFDLPDAAITDDKQVIMPWANQILPAAMLAHNIPAEEEDTASVISVFFWLVAAWVKSRAERPSVSGVNRQLHVQIGCKLVIRNRKDELTKQAKRNKLQIKPEGN